MKPIQQKLNRLWHAAWLQRWGVPSVIFMVAFLPRAHYPVSWPHLWSQRALYFADAILRLDLAGTFQRYHPGVSLMWLSGIGLKIYEGLQGTVPREQFFLESPTPPGLLVEVTAAQLLPLVLAISLGIALSYSLLRQLSGRTIALIAALFLALDPYDITYSKAVHLDALLASFMLLSTLFLLVYLKERQLHNLLLSGVFAGLAFLTKTPSIFLIPYAALVVTVTVLNRVWPELKTYNTRSWSKVIWHIIRPLLVWLGLASIVFVLLFPAIWVIPVTVLETMIGGILLHSGTAHQHSLYFLGRLWLDDPGLPFYLATIGFKTTLITLPLIVAGFIFGTYYIRSPKSRVLWAIIAYAFFLFLQMGLGQWKQISYLTPIFPALNIIAAFGLVWMVQFISRQRQWQPIALLAIVIVVQAVLVLRHHPYYGTHFNLLLGGSQKAIDVLPIQDQAEGMDLAAQYLNDLPHGQTKTAAVFHRNSSLFDREFVGRITYDRIPDADYRIYDVNSVLRKFQGQNDWYESWLKDQKNEPLFTIDFDGVTYVRVYGELPEDPAPGGPEFEVNYRIGEFISLKKVRLSKGKLTPGEPLTVVLYWETDGNIDGSYTVFNHLNAVDSDGFGQQDNIPVLGNRPTNTWVEEEVIEDPYYLVLDESLPAGEYELSVGMYAFETLVRIPAFDSSGNRLPDDRIIIGSVYLVPD